MSVLSKSPLAYVGGKAKMTPNIKNIIYKNNFTDRTYVEPFSGGFGLGLNLLYDNVVPKAIINDYDECIADFWHIIMYDTDNLIKLIKDIDFSLEGRNYHKELYMSGKGTRLERAFTVFYLNVAHTNGCLPGNVRGNEQGTGRFKMDAFFSKFDKIRRIRNASTLKDRIYIYNKDVNDLLVGLLEKDSNLFIFLDPPYHQPSERYYKYEWRKDDEPHIKLFDTLNNYCKDTPFILTYDNSDFIKDLYKDYLIYEYELVHSMIDRKKDTEIIITNLTKEQFEWEETKQDNIFLD